MQKNKRRLFWLFCNLITICITVSCNPSKKINRDFLYFQKGLDSIETLQFKETVIQTNDLLSIKIFSKTLNQEQAILFNLPVIQTGNESKEGYLVGMNGNIDLPILGSIKAAGLTKIELQTSLTEKLSNYIKNPFVLIRFLQFKVNVLGEVKTPGTQNFQSEYVTVFDALGAAGDLTDFGKREDVVVIREESTRRKYYKIDLRSGAVFQSPVYQLEPNDIVYVGANKKKLKELNYNTTDRQRNLQLFFAISSLAATLSYLIVNLVRNG